MNNLPQKQTDPSCYCVVYPSEAHSGNAKVLIWAIAVLENVSLSCYPVTDGYRYFLVVVGDNLSEGTKERIQQALLSGQPVVLRKSMVAEFIKRHRKEQVYGKTVTTRGKSDSSQAL